MKIKGNMMMKFSIEKYTQPESKKRMNTLRTVLHITATVLVCAVFFLCIYLHSTYPSEKAEELLFYLTNGSENAGSAPILTAAKVILSNTAILTVILIFIQYPLLNRKIVCRLSGKSEKVIQLFPINHRAIFTLIVSVLLISVGLSQIGFFDYMSAQISKSDFIENEYVDPSKTDIIAPEKKRNILVIEIESLETTMFTKEQGGVWDHEVIPEAHSLLSLDEATYFSSDDKGRGILDAYGTTWTTASLIANTSGVAFKVPVNQNNAYHSDNFLSGAYSLGDVLKENGYRNVLISGARTSFGGTKEYFTKHGQYEIIDSDSLSEYGLTLPSSQENEWGFSDEASFGYARRVLSDISADDQPWHMMISTIDCHFNGYTYPEDSENGYLGSVTSFDDRTENVYATVSRELERFVTWLREQPFYSDTTVIIFGDHVNMLSSFCDESENRCRGRYNLILNSQVKTDNIKNRVFTALDFYPTILTASGFTVKNDRLGLGVDLFSNTETLAEKYGLDKMNRQLELRSDFYINTIMGSEDYRELERKSVK